MENNTNCKINYDDKLKAVIMKWYKISFGEDYRSLMIEAKNISERKFYSNIVLDLTEGFDNELEDSEWVYKEFINSLSDINAKGIFFVLNDNNPLKDKIEKETNKWTKHSKIYYTSSVEKINL